MLTIVRSFKIRRCDQCGRVFRHGKWLFPRDLPWQSKSSYLNAEAFGYIDWEYRLCTFCENDMLA